MGVSDRFDGHISECMSYRIRFLFVCVNTLHPNQNFLIHDGPFPGLKQY